MTKNDWKGFPYKVFYFQAESSLHLEGWLERMLVNEGLSLISANGDYYIFKPIGMLREMTAMNEFTHGYAAFSKCGCITGVMVDMADKDTAEAVAEFIADGRRVERMLISEINAIGIGCKCAKAQPNLFMKGGE